MVVNQFHTINSILGCWVGIVCMCERERRMECLIICTHLDQDDHYYNSMHLLLVGVVAVELCQILYTFIFEGVCVCVCVRYKYTGHGKFVAKCVFA